jgi:hypothetical protein
MSAALPKDPNRVEIRCEDCARDLGPAAPTLVVCRYTGPEGLAVGLSPWWDLVGLGQRRPTRAGNTGPPPPDPPVQGVTGQAWISGRTFDQNVLRGRAVELACRRCNRRGWRRRRKLFAVAEQARAAGTSNAYLSLS